MDGYALLQEVTNYEETAYEAAAEAVEELYGNVEDLYETMSLSELKKLLKAAAKYGKAKAKAQEWHMKAEDAATDKASAKCADKAQSYEDKADELYADLKHCY
jgi:hypothetical protein